MVDLKYNVEVSYIEVGKIRLILLVMFGLLRFVLRDFIFCFSYVNFQRWVFDLQVVNLEIGQGLMIQFEVK